MATFELPESWVGPTYGRNLFLSREELMSLGRPGRFTSEESAVMNAVLPFPGIVAHAGEKGWDAGVISNQARVYVVDLTPEEVDTRIEQAGSRTAASLFKEATYTAGEEGEWSHSTINYIQTGSHTILFRDIDFYFRSLGEKTVVFVFIHSVGGTEYIRPILSSFKWRPD